MSHVKTFLTRVWLCAYAAGIQLHFQFNHDSEESHISKGDLNFSHSVVSNVSQDLFYSYKASFSPPLSTWEHPTVVAPSSPRLLAASILQSPGTKSADKEALFGVVQVMWFTKKNQHWCREPFAWLQNFKKFFSFFCYESILYFWMLLFVFKTLRIVSLAGGLVFEDAVGRVYDVHPPYPHGPGSAWIALHGLLPGSPAKD